MLSESLIPGSGKGAIRYPIQVRIFSLDQPFDTIVACIDQEWMDGCSIWKAREQVQGARGRFA
jgi:hypothetical protein